MEGEPAKGLLAHTPLIPSWSSNPIPYLSLSAGGLLALADLNTVAQRTAITGGSSWLDALVLVPGLHYQQAADALDQPSSSKGLAAALGVDVAAVETRPDGTEVRRYVVRNTAMVHYLRRLWTSSSSSDGEEEDESRGGEVETVNINVGMARQKNSVEAERILRRGMAMIRQRRLRATKQQQHHHGTDIFELDWLSHVFYILSPILTVTAATLMVLLRDHWGLAFLLALMLSRLLNIFTIRKRSRPSLPSPAQIAAQVLGRTSSSSSSSSSSKPTEYVITLGPRRRVVLRGRADDLQALTTRAWLRGKTALDGYCEAAGKLVVYAVAALSGNLTQAGALVLMALLLLSAGLLGLSNAHIRGLRVHGRVARPERRRRPDGQAPGKEERDPDSLDLEQGRRDGVPVEDVRGR